MGPGLCSACLPRLSALLRCLPPAPPLPLPLPLPCRLACLPAGLKDAEECIKLAPDFAKGYSRKGHLQFFMKVGRCCCTWGLQGGGGASREQAYLPAACVPTAFLRASALCHPGWLQEFDKAVETYQAGLERDPDNQELKDGLMRCVQAINKVGGWGGGGGAGGWGGMCCRCLC